MAVKDKTALDKIIRARTSLLVSNGFFGVLAMQLKLVERIDDPIIDTMGVDGKHLFYDTRFTKSMSDRECEGVICHEVMHCALKHMTRRQNRHPIVWNMACDHYINLDLLKSGFSLPTKDRDGKPFKICADEKFKGMSAEAIYDELMKNVKIITIDFKNFGGVLDAPGGGSEQSEIEKNWEINVRTAIEAARMSNPGNLPGSIQKLINDLKKPKVSWREKTRRFIDRSMVKEPSWARLGRRSWSSGVLMPGMASDRLQKLVFFVDVSGSVSYEMARSMISEVAGALDEGVADEIIVVYADTKVQHVDYFSRGDIVTCGRYTGGGTSFRASFDWLIKNEPDASCAIYLTDMGVFDFGEEPPCPVLWAVYCPESEYDHAVASAPFGEGIHVDNIYG